MKKLEMITRYQEYAIETYLMEFFEDLTEEEKEEKKQLYIKGNMKNTTLKKAKELYSKAEEYFITKIDSEDVRKENN